jgi:hypothetical protein
MMTSRNNLFAFVAGCALLLLVMACADEPAPETDPYGLPAGYCCCEFVVEGDILTEDALPAEECTAQTSGMCITVDPNRLTPHPCCPNATGERCGDGL